MFLWGRDDKAYQQAYQDVYAEDYPTNCTIVLKYLNVTKFSLEDDDAFEKRFLSGNKNSQGFSNLSANHCKSPPRICPRLCLCLDYRTRLRCLMLRYRVFHIFVQ